MDYPINITCIEELQMLNDTDELNRIFKKAKSAIVQGCVVQLIRGNGPDDVMIIENLSTESELLYYRESVFKYLKQ